MIKRIIPIIFLLLLTITETKAQYDASAGFLNFNRERSFGIMIYQKSFGFNFRTAWVKNKNVAHVFEYDFLNMKHPKELRIINQTQSANPGNPYIYGKLNVALFNRFGYGNKIRLSDKILNNSIGTSMIISGGPTIALLKPIYLDILYYNNNNTEITIQSERYDPEIHSNQSVINGNSGFFYGMDQLNARFGLYGKLAFQFDWNSFSDDLEGLEIGTSMELFPKDLPVMAFAENQRVWTTVYLSVFFGSKW